MKAKLLHDSFGDVRHLPTPPKDKPRLKHHVALPAGTVIDDPQAWILVRNGHAEPADDECKTKALAGGDGFPPVTEDELEHARDRYPQLVVGRITGDKRFDAPDPKAKETSMADAAESHAA